jgi:hypothetical protein
MAVQVARKAKGCESNLLSCTDERFGSCSQVSAVERKMFQQY